MKKLLPFTLLLAVGQVACSLPHPGENIVVPDRPGYTDTPVALDRGVVQFETGYTDDHAGPASYRSVGEVLLRAGIGANTELRVFGNSWGMRDVIGEAPVRGLEDFKVGAKVSLRAIPDSVHSFLPNIAALVQATLPTGATGIGAGVVQPEVKLAMNWTTPTPFSIYSNVAWTRAWDGAAWDDRGWFSTAVWYAATPRLAFFAEGLTLRSVGGLGTSLDYVDGGVTFLITDHLQLDARVGRGIGATAGSERFVGFGLAHRF